MKTIQKDVLSIVIIKNYNLVTLKKIMICEEYYSCN